jgi:hypothetical protein
MSRAAILGFAIAVILLNTGSETLAYNCGPHAYILRQVLLENGVLHTFCDCRPGYRPITNAITQGDSNPGCFRSGTAKNQIPTKQTKGSMQPAHIIAAPVIPHAEPNPLGGPTLKAESARKLTPKADAPNIAAPVIPHLEPKSGDGPKTSSTATPKNSTETASPGRLTLNSVPKSVKGGFVRKQADIDSCGGQSGSAMDIANGCSDSSYVIPTGSGTTTPTGITSAPSGLTLHQLYYSSPTAPQQAMSSGAYGGAPDTMGTLPAYYSLSLFSAQTVISFVLEAVFSAAPPGVGYLADKLIDAETEALSDIDIQPPPMGVSPYNQDILENADPNHPGQEYFPPSNN